MPRLGRRKMNHICNAQTDRCLITGNNENNIQRKLL